MISNTTNICICLAVRIWQFLFCQRWNVEVETVAPQSHPSVVNCVKRGIVLESICHKKSMLVFGFLLDRIEVGCIAFKMDRSPLVRPKTEIVIKENLMGHHIYW